MMMMMKLVEVYTLTDAGTCARQMCSSRESVNSSPNVDLCERRD